MSKDCLDGTAKTYLGPALASLLLVTPATTLSAQRDDEFARQRRAMVDLIVPRGVSDPATLTAMGAVPRHEFVPPKYRGDAYGDFPLPIGYGQTISQPYIVAYMTEVLRPRAGMKVLEVGTGSGYQAAVLVAAVPDPRSSRATPRCIAQREQSLILDSALLNSIRIRDEQTANLRDP